MQRFSLTQSIKVLVFVVLAIVVLYYGKSFLIPIALAGVLSMLLIGVVEWLQKKHFPHVLAILCAILIIVVVVAGIIGLITWQITDLAKNAGQLESNLTQKIAQLKQYIHSTFGMTPQEQQKVMQQQQQSGGSGISKTITSSLGSFGGIITDFLLMLIYIFLFLLYREQLKNFILKLVTAEKQQKAQLILRDIEKTSRNYFTGMLLMIVCLWIMYGIGFSIVGVKNAIFFAILCGILELIPFVGNLTGTAITILVNIAEGGNASIVVGILITYGVVQFLQGYILEPLVVGDKVSINPLFTIGGIVAGELVWGVPGMILAIPLLGMLKVVCDNSTTLQPFGYLMGEEKKKK